MIRHLLAFFALGALLFVAKRALRAELGPEPPEACPAVLVRVRTEATEAEVQRAIDEAVLVEEALKRGGALVDPVVRDRLVLAMRRQEPRTEADESDPALLARAVALGLPREDPVVRQRLAHQAEQIVLAPEAEGVTDAELARYHQAHAARYTSPARHVFTQIFFSRSRRGDRAEHDARAAAARLRRGAAVQTQPGDTSLLPAEWEADAPELNRRFGPGFATAVAKLSPRRWSEPVPSSYGLHLVWLKEAVPPRAMPLSEVRARVLADYRHDRTRDRLHARVRALRALYRVDVRRYPS